MQPDDRPHPAVMNGCESEARGSQSRGYSIAGDMDAIVQVELGPPMSTASQKDSQQCSAAQGTQTDLEAETFIATSSNDGTMNGIENTHFGPSTLPDTICATLKARDLHTKRLRRQRSREGTEHFDTISLDQEMTEFESSDPGRDFDHGNQSRSHIPRERDFAAKHVHANTGSTEGSENTRDTCFQSILIGQADHSRSKTRSFVSPDQPITEFDQCRSGPQELAGHLENKGFLPCPSSQSLRQLKCCQHCGFDARQVLYLTEKALQFFSCDVVPWDDLVNRSVPLSDGQKATAMQKLSLWALRDYALGMTVPKQRGTETQSVDSADRPTMTQPGSGYRGTETPSISASLDESLSSKRIACSDDWGLSDIEEEDNYTPASTPRNATLRHRQRGRPRKEPRKGPRKAWSSLEEHRLRAYVKEKQDWPEIAERLGRSQGAVEQHWRIMTEKRRRMTK
ncbi:hypothetical protein TruAng_012253 [Truncatella angustata]|nr:hypothetical protein TruAng_012253 [Truncatella angustata]